MMMYTNKNKKGNNMKKHNARFVQVFVVLAVAMFATFVFLGNLLDYDSNYQFVKHVLSMDTTFEGNKLMWRAITNEGLITAAYWGIILVEGLVAAFAWAAGAKMIKNLNKSYDKFVAAKSAGYYAFMLGFLLWFVGFIVIGTEWFAMWQSDIWNGKQTAMDITEVLGIFLVIFMLPIEQLKAAAKK